MVHSSREMDIGGSNRSLDAVFGICGLILLICVISYKGKEMFPVLEQIYTQLCQLRKFYNDSVRLLRRCTRPTYNEYTRICIATLIGFLMMGTIGFFVKLIHIPINNIIMS